MTYPGQQPPYPPAPPQNPGYPVQPGYPQQAPPQGYPQQGYPVQQGYYPQQAPPPPSTPQAPPPPSTPQAPLPKAGMGDYVDQPGAGAGALQFPVMGTRYTVTVARPLGDGDFPVQTDMSTGQPRRFSDGRPMVRMSVPVLIQPDAAHPDGHATLSVQGQLAEALKQAMAAVGAGEFKGVPEAGAVITVAWTSERPAKRAGYNNQKIYEVIYQRPPGAAQAQAAQQQPVQQYAGVAAQVPGQYPQVPQYQAPAPPPVPQYGPVAPGQPVAQPAQGMAGPAQQVAYAAQQGVQAAQAAQAPVMDQATQEKLNQLLGNQAAPPQ